MDRVRGVGRAMFAAVLLMIGGILNIIWGIAAIGNSHFFVQHQHYVFAHLRGWGWVSLIIGVLELIAAFSLFSGNEFGRYFAIVVASLAAITALLDIPSYPLWSIAVFALSLWIIQGLVVYGERDRRDAIGTGAGAGAVGTGAARRETVPPRQDQPRST
jgi:hypothetical protein